MNTTDIPRHVGTDTGPLTQTPSPLRAITALASDISADASTLVRQHGSLLMAELGQSRDQAILGVGLLAGGGFAAAFGGMCLLIGCVQLTAWLLPSVPEWGAWLIWGGVAALAAAIAIPVGLRRLSYRTLVPHRTLSSLKESWTCLANRLS